MVDSSDTDRMDECRIRFHEILQDPNFFNDLFVIVYANKQDVDNALPPSVVAEKLMLDQVKQRHCIKGVSCVSSDLEELCLPFDWLKSMIDKEEDKANELAIKWNEKYEKEVPNNAPNASNQNNDNNDNNNNTRDCSLI
eukprot:TRINITY_DN5994_c0_g1_i4.p2 TRINITY_DN5994_c0_g1~~TRINITY_DN5994_c0_g1_i4.p2  ORF type:complete len:139 (+),score=27.77 TRINITY_DN5994_c0_g1_i4:1109-1525(+)